MIDKNYASALSFKVHEAKRMLNAAIDEAVAAGLRVDVSLNHFDTIGRETYTGISIKVFAKVEPS